MLTACAILRGRLRGHSILAVGSHSSVHVCEYAASTTSAWAAPHNKLKVFFIKNEQKQVFIKIFLERNLADVRISKCMSALTYKVHKQEVPCTQ